MARRYEYAGLFSKKFEELELKGTELLTRAGKKGTEPPPTSAPFSSAVEASKRFLARVAELEKSGFKRAFFAAPVVPLAHNPGLENALYDGGDGWEVYADWAQSQGHLVGELAALKQRADPVVAEAFLANHDDALFGPLAATFTEKGDFQPEFGALQWEHGFLRHARLGVSSADSKVSLAERARILLELPVARFLTRLTFGLEKLTLEDDFAEVIDALIASPMAQRLDSLFLGDFLEPDEHQMSWAGVGDVSRVWELKGLKHVRLRGGRTANLGTIVAPELRSFIRESGGLSASEWSSIVSAKWPKLEKLEVWTGDPGYGAEVTLELMKPLLSGTGLPALRSLGLRNSQLTNELIPALATSPLLKQLTELDLSMGTLDDDGADMLMEHARHFAHLKVINLEGNQINDATRIFQRDGSSTTHQGMVRQALPNASFENQRPLDEGEPGFRFVAVSE